MNKICKKTCSKETCKFWIDYPEDDNCCLVSIEKNKGKPLTLEQVGLRLNYTPARIKQIQDEAVEKMKDDPFFQRLMSE